MARSAHAVTVEQSYPNLKKLLRAAAVVVTNGGIHFTIDEFCIRDSSLRLYVQLYHNPGQGRRYTNEYYTVGDDSSILMPNVDSAMP